ncbi:MAG: carboxylating nicotinate-nucleotide diphosphorylase, partial [Polyangiaceae bacterium]
MNPSYLIDQLVDLALSEDLSGGDLTSEATVAADDRAIARAVAHSSLVVCGGDVFARVFYRVDPGLRVERRLADGARAQPNDVLWIAEGATRSLLMAERTALNFAQRMSGIATLTRRFVDALPNGALTRIVDTRKTSPGMRFLERYAVRTGGGHNHRDNLGSAVLIKDNHIVAAGGVREALERARKHAPHTSRLEIEVESLEMLDEALEA